MSYVPKRKNSRNEARRPAGKPPAIAEKDGQRSPDNVLSPAPVPRKSDVVRRLEAELRETKEKQQHLIAQLECGNAELTAATQELAAMNEELQSANEELTASQEELQSANEELTASQEELQSMNEELATVNSQLQEKIQEVTAVNDDLANLLVSTDIATVFLDTKLRIKRFTTAASRVVHLQSADVGRPLHQLSTNLINVNLSEEARSVLEGLKLIEKEVTSKDGRQYFLRGLPYRTREHQVQGVVLTLAEVTKLKRAERELNSSRERVADDLRRMTRLHELGEQLAAGGDARVMLEAILRAAIEITHAEMGTIQECDEAGVLVIAAQMGFKPPLLQHFGHLDAHADTACARAMLTQERVIVEDVMASPLFGGSLSRLLAAGVHAVQSTPLFDRSGRFLGMLSTHYRIPHRFDDAEQRWLDLLARHAGDAIERQRIDRVLTRSREQLERRVAERTQWLTLLHQISQLINEAPAWDAALQRVLNRLCTVEEWQVGYVYLPDPESPNVLVPAITCVGQERFQAFHQVSERQRYTRGEPLPGQVYATGDPLWANDTRELLKLLPTRASAAEQAGLVAGVAMPIRVANEVIAVLELFSDRAHPRNDWFDNLMPAIADQIGRILEREQTTGRMAELIWREQQDLLHTLHDVLGQTLTGLGMLASCLRQKLGDANKDAADTAAEIAKQSKQALEQVRQLSRSLFPVEVEAESLTAALREFAFATESLHRIRVCVEGSVPHGFGDGGAATQLYRIAQEAVTNAVKHAQARSIVIQIDGQAGMLRLRITDDGIGIGNARSTNGIGLQIMRYRAESIGGILTIEPGSAAGTVVVCTLRAAPVSTKSMLTQSMRTGSMSA